MGANGKMQYNPGWESGSMKTLAAHGLAGGIVQDRTVFKTCGEYLVFKEKFEWNDCSEVVIKLCKFD
jgi:hypothetical protein